ncbi:MAG TPA: peptide deformylase [Gemmatimonadales bacterium]|nr:peptide deformylase [Gemmatimonadales bacterium]
MILKIVQAGDPVLRRVAEAVRPEDIAGENIQQLIALMRETMRDAPGVGLAAPQVGVSLALAVIEVLPEYLTRRGLSSAELAEREMEAVPFHVLVNPRLTVVDAAAAVCVEGCLSVRGYAARVPRARAVRVSALDHRGAPVEISARGWHARILQHEIDHLEGKLYIDVMETRSFTTIENQESGKVT